MSYEDVNLEEATIVDVREPCEYVQGCIDCSVNIPIGQIPYKIEDFKNMPKPLVLCCASGSRSEQAVQYLAANGVENIHNGGSWNMVSMRMN